MLCFCLLVNYFYFLLNHLATCLAHIQPPFHNFCLFCHMSYSLAFVFLLFFVRLFFYFLCMLTLLFIVHTSNLSSKIRKSLWILTPQGSRILMSRFHQALENVSHHVTYCNQVSFCHTDYKLSYAELRK